MTEEIKEMLWKIKRQNTYDDIGYFKTPLSNDDADKLLNYITNLQKENENLKLQIKGYEQERENVLNDIVSRNEKASDFILSKAKEYKPHFAKVELNTADCIELLNILEGGDE